MATTERGIYYQDDYTKATEQCDTRKYRRSNKLACRRCI